MKLLFLEKTVLSKNLKLLYNNMLLGLGKQKAHCRTRKGYDSRFFTFWVQFSFFFPHIFHRLFVLMHFILYSNVLYI